MATIPAFSKHRDLIFTNEMIPNFDENLTSGFMAYFRFRFLYFSENLKSDKLLQK